MDVLQRAESQLAGDGFADFISDSIRELLFGVSPGQPVRHGRSADPG
ncbi:MAG TPA: hypothetical protein VE526_00470 [Solirubrobacteraceae bacterium]|nr:hypothetical protein [Solirubrobacteraceae bacterium]